MRNPEQQVTPAMWCLWQLGPLYTGLAIWKSKLKEAQGLCISLDPRGSTRYSFLLFSWEVARKLVEHCFCQRLKEKRKSTYNTKQNKTPYTPQTHPPSPTPQNHKFNISHSLSKTIVSTVSALSEFLAWISLKWGFNVPALKKKYLIFNSQSFFWYTTMRSDQTHIRFAWNLFVLCTTFIWPSKMG